jgi:flagellar biosynthesis/type III secretory pathway chaperone
MNGHTSDLAAALERVAGAMDQENAALRSGSSDELAAATERKRIAVEAAEAVLRQTQSVAQAAASRAERNRVEQAAHRLRAAAAQNAAVLQGALEGTRRLFGCLVEAAQQASSTGTYGPDGNRRRAAETVATIHRSA